MPLPDSDHPHGPQTDLESTEMRAAIDAAHAAFQAERARHRSSLDQVEQVRAALKQTMDDLSKTTIYSPMAGTVSQLNKEVGEIALGSQFQEDVIMVVSNLAGMEALVDVDVRREAARNLPVRLEAAHDHAKFDPVPAAASEQECDQEQNKLTRPIDRHELRSSYGIFATPTLLIIDAEGRPLTDPIVGYNSASEYKELLNASLVTSYKALE